MEKEKKEKRRLENEASGIRKQYKKEEEKRK
jgi:hypothetical protein